MAFNDGLFEDIDADAVPDLMGRLSRAVTTSTLTLENDRAVWSEAVGGWLAGGDGTR